MKLLMLRRIVACGALAVVGLLGAKRSWTEAIPVQMPDSRVNLLRVTSDWTSSFDIINHEQGTISFEDCVTFADESGAAIAHVHFVFAAVNTNGQIKKKLLPLEVDYSKQPKGKLTHEACRNWGYANGDTGLWLVAWVSEVYFADGTSWHAPPIEQMQPYIIDALPKE